MGQWNEDVPEGNRRINRLSCFSGFSHRGRDPLGRVPPHSETGGEPRRFSLEAGILSQTKGNEMKLNKWTGWTLAMAVAVVFAGSGIGYASEIDDSIGPAFKQTYVYRTFLVEDSIQVDSKDGAVTLTGTVAKDFHKTLAQETVGAIPGVTSVENQLATPAEVATESNDQWLGNKVNLALMFHRKVNAGKTEIDVKEGVVTLKGEAATQEQKDLTGAYAADIEGVTKVNNEMTVAEQPVPDERTFGEKMDDMSIVAQVKTALLTHRSTSALQTKVVSLNGEVTLTGVAQSEAEMALASKLVEDIQGVASVKNDMTIQDVVVQ